MSAALGSAGDEPAGLPSAADVADAARRLAGVAHRTPVLTSRTLDERLGARVFFKCETMQRGGAFKFRGAYNAVSRLDADAKRRGIVAFSSGNHAQAIALACRLEGAPACILMPEDAPASKVAATAGYGAEILRFDRYRDDRDAMARGLAAERGLTLIPPFDHPDVIAGQGTAALELLDETGPLDVVVACLGGGGLLAGTALAAAERAPDAAVFGVEPEAGDDGRRSLEAGRLVTIPVPVSIADGALTARLGHLTFALIRRHVREIATVSDAELVDAMRFFVERMKIVVEPTGCLGAAAVMSGRIPVRGKRVGVILSGGNVDPARLGQLLA